MSYDGSEGEFITLSEGADMTLRYRGNFSSGVQGHYFGRDKIEDILDQSGCVGIRIYYGQDESEIQELIIVGVDANGDDILATEPLILDRAIPCPPNCSAENDLNC